MSNPGTDVDAQLCGGVLHDIARAEADAYSESRFNERIVDILFCPRVSEQTLTGPQLLQNFANSFQDWLGLEEIWNPKVKEMTANFSS